MKSPPRGARRHRASSRTGHILALGILVACAAPDGGRTPFEGKRPVGRGTLEPGRTLAASIEGDTVDRWVVPAGVGDVLRIEADSESLDLVLRLRDPLDRVALIFDSPSLTSAPERFCWHARDTGLHTIEVAAAAGGGRYRLRVDFAATVVPADLACAEASALMVEAASAPSWAQAAEIYARAADRWSVAGDRFAAAMARSEAAAHLRRDGATAEAVTRFERALEDALAADHPLLEVSIRNRLGMALAEIHAYARAEPHLERARQLASETRDLRGMASTLTNRGLVDVDRGEPYRALDRYRQALAIWRQLDDPLEIAQALESLADALGVIDHHDEALDALEEALGLVRQPEHDGHRADLLVSTGWVHHLRGAPERGLPMLEEALAIRRRAADPKAEAGVLDRLASVLAAAGRLADAEAAYRTSLALSSQLGLPAWQAATETNLGCLLAKTDRAEIAKPMLRRTRAHYREAGDPKAEAHAAYCLALAARQEQATSAAIEHIRVAMAIVEDLRQQAREDGHYYRPVWLWQRYAELEVDVLLERYEKAGSQSDLDAAFEAADRARARTLYELVSTSRQAAEHAAENRLRAEALRLERQLSELGAERAALRAAQEDRAPTSVDAEVRRHQLALERVRAAMRANARAAGLLDMPQPVSKDAAQSLLSPGTAMLTYVLGDEKSHLLVLTSRDLKAFPLPSRQTIEEHAQALYNALRSSNVEARQWPLVAATAGKMLLPTVSIPANIERLVISAEGYLFYVPFAALVSPRATLQGADGSRLVMDDFEVSFMPSAAVWAALRNRRRARPPAEKTVAVFADPVFSTDDDRFAGAYRAPQALEPGARTTAVRGIRLERLPEGKLPRLPATAREAESILAYVAPGERLDRRAFLASKQVVLDTDLRPYRILHFATHAWIDEQLPELSGLVLSRVDERGQAVDGALYLHEIDRLELGAELTVLSGCQTALGKHVRGDGLLGLTQAFLRAGSSQVLVSLWSLDDAPAATLMEAFYAAMLADGETPAAALRNAQRWARALPATSAPRFWAPFALQGDG